MLLHIIAATVLSISSTNEYHFTRPASTNLEGKTYVLDGGLIPRYEDIAFLRESLFERNAAVTPRIDILPPTTVPLSYLFSNGRFGGATAEKVFFCPSFGKWAPYTGYNDGYFIKPGVEISTDFWETGPEYLVNSNDTSVTNTIYSFLSDPVSACVDTNLFSSSTLEGVVCLSNIVAAFSLVTNRYKVLSVGTCWSHREKSIRTTERAQRSRLNLQYSQYTFPRYDGRTGSGTFLSSFDVSGWVDDGSYSQTNAAPYLQNSYYLTSRRQTYRYYGWKYVYYGSRSTENIYDVFQVGDDIDTWRLDTDELGGSGNIIAKCAAIDRMLTNTVEDVTCIVVCRFRVRRTDTYSGGGLSPIPPTTNMTNYFVSVSSGVANKIGKDGESTVWDTGVSFKLLVDDIINGELIRDWVRQCSYPEINVQTPTRATDSTYADHTRQAIIYPEIIPYFYYRRKWNARIPKYEGD